MEPTHPDTNASLEIFEMNKAHAFPATESARERESEGDITNTPFDTDTMAPLLNANTVILPQQTHQPTLLPPPPPPPPPSF